MSTRTRTRPPVRPWRGQSADERAAERREQLLQAGLERFAGDGYASTTVRAVCREAGLTERYFYESFADREALLSALVDRIVEDFLRAVMPGVALVPDDLELAVRRAIEGFVASLTDDPRRARVLLVEAVGVSPAAEEHRRAVIGRLVRVVQQAAAAGFGAWAGQSPQIELIARALVGAAQELLVAHVRAELSLDRDALVENLCLLFLAAGPVAAGLQPPDPRQTKDLPS